MKNNVIYYNKRISKIQNLKRKKRKAISIVILSTILIILTSIITYKIYKKLRCRDLQYAVEYEMTKGTSSERLLRVQHITLIFNDKTNAIVEVSGLSKEDPHYETTLKGNFKKDSLNSWKLIRIEKS